MQLQKIICTKTKGSNYRKYPAKTYFQALRIVVNDELNALKQGLTKTVNLLEKYEILVVITFHSLEERFVNHFFKKISPACDFYDHNVPLYQKKPSYSLITKKPITPTLFEIKKNHKSHSAKLRILKKNAKS